MRRFSREFLWGAVILMTALAVRLLYLAEVHGQLRFQNLIVDAFYHDQWARTLAAGDWLGKTAFFRAPLYPYVVGVIYALFGPHTILVRLFQFLLGSITALLIYRLGMRLYGLRAGVIAGLLAALYWVFIYHEGEILITTLSIFLQVLLLTTLVNAHERPSFGRFLLAGVVLGLAAIARPNILLFGVLAAVWFFVAFRREHPAGARLRWLGAAVLGTVLMIAPVTIRNYVVSGDFVLISWQGGSTYYTGNHPGADGYSAHSPGVRTYWWEGFRDVVLQAERAAGHPLTPQEVSRYWFGKAVDFARGDPGAFLALQVRKLGLFWFAQEKGDESDTNIRRRDSRLLRLLPFGFGLVAPLGLVGLVLAWRGPRAGHLIVLYAFAWMISVVIFFVTSRFRLPVVPALLIGSGVTVASAARWQAARDIRHGGAALAAVLALGVLFHIDFYGAGGENWAQAHFNNAVIFSRVGKTEDAVREYREALQLAPNYLDAQNNLGSALLRAGQLEEALTAFEKAAEIDPQFATARYNMGVVQERLGRTGAARASYELALSLDPDFIDAQFALGTLYAREGNKAQSLALYERALKTLERTERITPASGGEEREHYRSSVVRANVALGQDLLDRGQNDAAMARFDAAVAADPLSPSAHYARGMALLSLGRDDDGEGELREAIGLDPDGTEARYALALHYASRGQGRQAASQLEEVLRIQPDHRGALFNLGVVRAQQGLLDPAIELWEKVLELDPNDQEARTYLQKAREAKKR